MVELFSEGINFVHLRGRSSQVVKGDAWEKINEKTTIPGSPPACSIRPRIASYLKGSENSPVSMESVTTKNCKLNQLGFAKLWTGVILLRKKGVRQKCRWCKGLGAKLRAWQNGSREMKWKLIFFLQNENEHFSLKTWEEKSSNVRKLST